MRYERVLGGEPVEYAEHQMIIDGRLRRFEAPKEWSVADVNQWAQWLAPSVPTKVKRIRDHGVPEWASRSSPHDPYFACEASIADIFARVAGRYIYWGCKLDVFDDEQSARAFYEDMMTGMERLAITPVDSLAGVGMIWAYAQRGREPDRFGVWTGSAQELLSAMGVVRDRELRTISHDFLTHVRDEAQRYA